MKKIFAILLVMIFALVSCACLAEGTSTPCSCASDCSCACMTEGASGACSSATCTCPCTEENYASDWYMQVLTDPAVTAEYPYCAFVDLNGDGNPALIVSTTEDSFIGDEDHAILYLDADGARQAMEIGGNAGEVFYANLDEHTLTHYSRMAGEGHLAVYSVSGGELTPVTTLDYYAQHHAPTQPDNEDPVYLQDNNPIDETTYDALKDKYAKDGDAISYAPAPGANASDPYLLGDWMTKDAQAEMSIARGVEEGTWAVEVIGPQTHNAYIFHATIAFDSDRSCFAYSDGEYWFVPITDGEGDVDLGAPEVSGTTGTFTFTGDPEHLILSWNDSQTPDDTLDFYFRGDADHDPAIDSYVGQWQAEGYDLEIAFNPDDASQLDCVVTHMTDGHKGVRYSYEGCTYDDVGNAVTSLEVGVKEDVTVDDQGNVTPGKTHYRDGAAAFALNEDGQLTWTDFKEAPGEDEITFERVEANLG